MGFLYFTAVCFWLFLAARVCAWVYKFASSY